MLIVANLLLGLCAGLIILEAFSIDPRLHLPSSVRAAFLSEIIFSCLGLALSFAVFSEMGPWSYRIVISLNLVWIYVTLRLKRGSHLARRLMVPFAALQCLYPLPLIGVPFSAITIWGLYWNRESREFYSARSRTASSGAR